MSTETAGPRAVPIPADPSLGAGAERALVLGGGGEYFAAWMAGYLHTLREGGVDPLGADVTIGTSAGSLVGAAVSGGHLGRMAHEFDLFARFPQLLTHLAHQAPPTPSQTRALQLLQGPSVGDQAAIRELGRAAMAARNGPIEQLERSLLLLVGTGWPSETLHTTAVDCYTGERLVCSHDSGLWISHAVSASMSVPGAFGPTWLGDRLCMDGGMATTGTHCDLVAGARRVLIISLVDGLGGSQRLSALPNTIQQEVADLRAGGSEVLLVSANPDPGVDLLSAAAVGDAMAVGRERATADLPAVRALWG